MALLLPFVASARSGDAGTAAPESWLTPPCSFPAGAPYTVHQARVVRVPDKQLVESILTLDDRSFVPLTPRQASHLLSGANFDLDAALKSDARAASARASEREREARDPFFKDQAQWMLAEARDHRAVAAEATRLRRVRLTPYLVRAVVFNEGTGGFSVHFKEDELCVFHGSLGRGAVPMKRLPVVMYLERSPRVVHIGASIAE